MCWAKRSDTQQQIAEQKSKEEIAEQKSKEEIAIASVPAPARYLLPVVILLKIIAYQTSHVSRISENVTKRL